MNHLRRLLDLDGAEFGRVLDRTKALRQGAEPRRYSDRLLGLVFEKPSTRTRVSLEAAAAKLGADHLFISARDSQLGRGEPIEDTARVLGRYLDAIAIRTFAQATVDAMADHAGIPVINALSDLYHPCQAVADLATVEQHLDRREAFVMTYFGDGNNVFHSLGEAATLLPFDLRFAGPPEDAPDPELIEELHARGARIEVIHDPEVAARDADVLYTDVWSSMGESEDPQARHKRFEPYRIDAEKLALGNSPIVLHCLPAHRGEEITTEVMEGPRSRIFDQAENRLWAQMAILEYLWGGESDG